jgi:flagellar motor switch protein FliM
MKKYKATHYSPKDFTPTEVETDIPDMLVTQIETALKNMPSIEITPPIINIESNDVFFGVRDAEKIKYKISITLSNI